MAVQADTRYAAEVIAAQSTQSEAGTFGILVRFSTSEGEIERILWVSAGALDMTRKSLHAMGASENQMAAWEWLEDPSSLVGARCEIVTEEKKGQDGKDRVEIRWINSIRRKAERSKAQAAALLFVREPEPDDGLLSRPRSARREPEPDLPEPPPYTGEPDDVPF